MGSGTSNICNDMQRINSAAPQRFRTKANSISSVVTSTTSSSLRSTRSSQSFESDMVIEELAERCADRHRRRTSELQHIIDFKLESLKVDNDDKVELLLIKANYHYLRAVDMKIAVKSVQLFLNSGKEVFSNPSTVRKFFTEKYSDANKYKEFTNIYGERMIADSLADLILPAVYSSGALRTENFTRYDARENPEKNFRYLDVIMAATAAPTFFPPYYIEGAGYFLDATLTAYNPAQKAYEEAVHRLNKNDDELYVLSLGTGSYANDAYAKNVSTAKGILYWASHTPEFMMSGQGYNADIFMTDKLGERYNRWQVYYEDKMELDSHDSMNNLIELGTQFVEEQSDEINTVVEILLEK